MIVLCNFVLINLFLAVVADEYTEQELQESEAREKQQIQEVIGIVPNGWLLHRLGSTAC